MEGKRGALYMAMVIVLLFAGLTVSVMVQHGPDILTLVSLVVIAMFAFGLYGALTEDRDR